MGKAAKSKREEFAETKGEEYEFKLPAFDERAFIRREMLSARASFYVLGLGVAAGLASVAVHLAPVGWTWGWLPILAAIVGARPMLQKLGFPDDVTSWKAMIGNYFMILFTGLAVWILGVNVL